VSALQSIAGRVFAVRCESVQVMSDIWEYIPCAHYIDELGRQQRRCLNALSDAVVDCSPEAIADYRQHCYEQQRFQLINRREYELSDVTVRGRVVRVAKGRTDKGLCGKVVAVIQRHYGASFHKTRPEPKLGIAIDDVLKPNGFHANVTWVWARNCIVEILEPVDYSELDAIARVNADQLAARLSDEIAKACQRPVAA
jgi:hypothetical protein